MWITAGSGGLQACRNRERRREKPTTGDHRYGPRMRHFRLRWWELLLLAAPLGAALLFLLGGLLVQAAVLFALIVFVIASRAQIVERNVAGGYATVRAVLLSLKWLALFAIYIVIVGLFWVIKRDDWTSDTRGATAMWALAGLAFFVCREILVLGRESDRWLRGGDMERKTAVELDKLRETGWVVSHDLLRDDDRGNIDHFVVGPTGAFAIETKSGKSSASGRGQAVSGAVWAKEKFGQRWVTAILCVDTDPPAKPEKHGWVWVLGLADLAEFMRRPAR